MTVQVTVVETQSNKLEHSVQLISEGHKQLENDSRKLASIIEQMDNNLWKNNQRLRGLKEELEEQDLKTYLEKLLTTCMGSDTEEEKQLALAYRLGAIGRGRNRNRNRDIILGLSHGALKALVVDSLWDRPRIVIEDQQLTFYSDLCPLMLHKRRGGGGLTAKLTVCGVPYKWGFTHKLLIDYRGKVVIIKTIAQARSFEKEIVIETLNSPLDDSDKTPTRRDLAIYRVGK